MPALSGFIFYSQVRKIMTLAKSVLATAFLQLADQPIIEKHTIEGIGEIGLLQLSLAAQQKWSAAPKDMGAVVLLKNTVCDPETGVLVLESLSEEELKRLPVKTLGSILDKVYKQNGMTKNKDVPEELKNSQADQS